MCFIGFHIFLEFKGISWKKKHKVGHVHFADLYNTFEQRNLHYNPYKPELDFRLYMKNIASKPVWLITPMWTCQCQSLEAFDAWMRPHGRFHRSFGRVVHWNIHINRTT